MLIIASGCISQADQKHEELESVNKISKKITDHLCDMNDLMAAYQVCVGSERDEIIQQLASQRNSFNKSLCNKIGEISPHKNLIGFYVYQAHESEAAIKKLQEHIEQVQLFSKFLQEKMIAMSINDTQKMRADQVQGDFINQAAMNELTKLIDSFKQEHCNAVGFGFIPAK